MKLTSIILEADFDKYRDKEDSLAREINNKFGGDPYVSMGEYAGGRADDDPRKDKGFGSRVQGIFVIGSLSFRNRA